MNWVTTNIRLPDDLYMELKMKAARERKSVAAIIRERLAGKKTFQKKNTKKLLRELREFRKKMGKEHPGLNLSKALIEMRYEQ